MSDERLRAALAEAVHVVFRHGYHGSGWDHGDGDIADALLDYPAVRKALAVDLDDLDDFVMEHSRIRPRLDWHVPRQPLLDWIAAHRSDEAQS